MKNDQTITFFIPSFISLSLLLAPLKVIRSTLQSPNTHPHNLWNTGSSKQEKPFYRQLF